MREITAGELSKIFEEHERWIDTDKKEGKRADLSCAGLRLQEFLSLEWSRVNLVRRTILIKETKNGNPKTLPLNKIALDVLNQRSKVKSIKNDYVFFNSNGKKINPHVLRTSFTRC